MSSGMILLLFFRIMLITLFSGARCLLVGFAGLWVFSSGSAGSSTAGVTLHPGHAMNKLICPCSHDVGFLSRGGVAEGHLPVSTGHRKIQGRLAIARHRLHDFRRCAARPRTAASSAKSPSRR